MNHPTYLSDCRSDIRNYPVDWKWEYYKFNGGMTGGYFCPICHRKFLGLGKEGFANLHGDHALAWSRGGRTTWENLQLLCGPCNLKKSASWDPNRVKHS